MPTIKRTAGKPQADKHKAGSSTTPPQQKSESPRRHPWRLLIPRGRVLLALLVVVLLGWGMQSVWEHVSLAVIHRDRYLLRAERITLSPLPEWIRGDVRTEVIRHAGLDRRLSVLDPSFMQIIEDAFVLHPWVESVNRITRSLPPGVHVELSYREPVAVVEMPGQQGVELIPIDRYAVHLPAEDVPQIRRRYLPRIGGIVARPPVGQQWADERVTGAARLAVQLASYWEEFDLVDILPSARPEIRGAQRFFVYDLITRGGTRIVWGAQAGLPEEDDFGTKLDRLRTCIASYGPFDSVRGPAVVDVRSELSITPRTVKKPSAMKQAAKTKPAAAEALVK